MMLYLWVMAMTISYATAACNYSCASCSTSPDECSSCSPGDNRELKGSRACLCKTGYYDDGTNSVCQACSAQISNCNDCFYNSSHNSSNAGSLEKGCFSCQTGYFLNNAGTCDSLRNNCTSGQAVNLTTNNCSSCPTGCLQCSDLSSCTTCNNSGNFYMNPDTNQCDPCPVENCDICNSFTECQTCKSTYTLSDGQCGCVSDEFENIAITQCESCSPYCQTCFGPSQIECLTCVRTDNRVLSGTECVCDTFNYQENSTAGVVQCQKVDANKCDRGYFRIEALGECIPICGDGVVVAEQCDDANIINSDGCSDQCYTESRFTCSNENLEISVCRLTGQISYEEYLLEKDPTANILNVKLKISPKSRAYNEYNLASVLHVKGGFSSILSATYDYQSSQLSVQVFYEVDLRRRSMALQVKPEFAYTTADGDIYETQKVTFSCPSSSFLIKTANNLEINAYSDDDYESAKQTQIVSLVFMILGIVVSGMCLFLRNSLPPLINVSALQISYMSLVTITGLTPQSSSFTSLKPIVGYNYIYMFEEPTEETINYQVKSIGFTQSFANNFNVMFFIEVSLLVLSGLLFLAAHKKKALKLVSKIIQKEALLVIFFNFANVIFSLSLIRQADFLSVIFCAISLLIAALQIAHLLFRGTEYFGMTEVFDLSEKGHFKKFVGVYFFSRIGSCLSLGLLVEQPGNGLIAATTFQALMVLPLAFIKPFFHFYSNILVLSGEIMAICFFGAAYASKRQDIDLSNAQAGQIMFSLFGAQILFVILNIIYSLYTDCSETGKKLKVYNELYAAREKIQEEKVKEVQKKELEIIDFDA